MRVGCRSVIAMGYYLKRIRDNRFYRDGGYKNFGEYAKAECGMTEDVASRTIKKMEVFSEGGNSPIMAKKWEDFSTSKLQEILYLTDEQRKMVASDMTVKKIREIRKPKEIAEPDPLGVEGSVGDMLLDAPEKTSQEALIKRYYAGEVGIEELLNTQPTETLATSQETERDWQAVPGAVLPESDDGGTPLEVLVFDDCRTKNTLMRAGIETVEQLQGLDDLGMMKIRGMSRLQLADIMVSLKKWEEESHTAKSESKRAESELNLPEPEWEEPESENTVPVYDKWILLKMIDEVEDFLNHMDEDWRRDDPAWFTRQAMSLEAYYLLLDKYEGKKGTEE